MNISQALNVSGRSVSYRDAEILLAHALLVDRSFLHTHPNRILSNTEKVTYEKLLQRRERNEPVAYILGSKEFYGHVFACDSRALIPRPETEGIIDILIPWLNKRFSQSLAKTNKPCPLRILEIGTGSGNIAITLSIEASKKHIPLTILATDISANALSLAQENAKTLAVKSYTALKFIVADMFSHHDITSTSPFDVIVANLPYVEEAWRTNPLAQEEVIFHEPDVALFGGGNDGLQLYGQFFRQVTNYLCPDGMIVVEHGEAQGKALRLLASKADFNTIRTHKDYADLERITEAHLQ